MEDFVSKAPGQIAAAAFCSKSKSSEVIFTVTEVVRFAMHLSCRLHPHLRKESRYNKKPFCARIDANAGIRPNSSLVGREGLRRSPTHWQGRKGCQRCQRMAYRVGGTRGAVQLTERVLRKNLSGLRQFLVLQIVRCQQSHERIAEEVLILPVVESPCHLLQVGGEMFHRDFMPRAHNSALEKRERGFNRVRGYAHLAFVADVLFGPVVNALVLRFAVGRRAEIIEFRFIGHNDINGLVNVALNNLVNLFLIQWGIGLNEVEMSAALTNADYRDVLLPLIGIVRVTADVHLIDFYGAREFMIRLCHRLADAVTEIPRRLVSHTQGALELVCRHTLAALTKQVGAEKPLPQVQMCIVEDGCCGNGELVMA